MCGEGYSKSRRRGGLRAWAMACALGAPSSLAGTPKAVQTRFACFHPCRSVLPTEAGDSRLRPTRPSGHLLKPFLPHQAGAARTAASPRLSSFPAGVLASRPRPPHQSTLPPHAGHPQGSVDHGGAAEDEGRQRGRMGERPRARRHHHWCSVSRRTGRAQEDSGQAEGGRGGPEPESSGV